MRAELLRRCVVRLREQGGDFLTVIGLRLAQRFLRGLQLFADA